MGAFKQLNTQLQDLINEHGRELVLAAVMELLPHRCVKCKHVWNSRAAGMPKQCPCCKSRYWRGQL